MGACDIGRIITKDADRAEVLEAIGKWADEDARYNGHQDGYSGDWQTICDIRFNPYKIFETQDEAYDFAIDSTEKREAMVVKFKSSDGEIWTGVFGWAAI